jgi:hypothetical protein
MVDGSGTDPWRLTSAERETLDSLLTRLVGRQVKVDRAFEERNGPLHNTMIERRNAAQDHVLEYVERLIEARTTKDTERLNWLDAQGRDVTVSSGVIRAWYLQGSTDVTGSEKRGPISLREAVDKSKANDKDTG